MKQTKITKSARGEACSVRLPHICNFNEETTVFAHLGVGTSKRAHDLNGCYACSSCHDAIDGRFNVRQIDYYDDLPDSGIAAMIERCKASGKSETQQKLLDKGLIKIC